MSICMTCGKDAPHHQLGCPEATPTGVRKNPLSEQVAGSHYKDMVIQPVEYIHANSIGYLEGNVIKYVSRWRKKNGVVDLQKARHYLDLLISLEGNK
jgi:hypothetical protein